jgi:hypothetical protein
MSASESAVSPIVADCSPELPVLEPTQPSENHNLLELSKWARSRGHHNAAFALLVSNEILAEYDESGDFRRACVGAENTLSDRDSRHLNAHGYYAAIVSLVSLAVEVGALPNGAAACCGEIDAPRPRSTPQTAFAAHAAASERPECARALRHAFDRVAELARKGMKHNK